MLYSFDELTQIRKLVSHQVESELNYESYDEHDRRTEIEQRVQTCILANVNIESINAMLEKNNRY